MWLTIKQRATIAGGPIVARVCMLASAGSCYVFGTNLTLLPYWRTRNKYSGELVGMHRLIWSEPTLITCVKSAEIS